MGLMAEQRGGIPEIGVKLNVNLPILYVKHVHFNTCNEGTTLRSIPLDRKETDDAHDIW